MKIVEEKNEKVFTKNMGKDIIKKKYNPLNKDKGFYERKGLHMKETKDAVLDEAIKELNLIERIFFKKKFIRIYNKVRIDIVNAMLK